MLWLTIVVNAKPQAGDAPVGRQVNNPIYMNMITLTMAHFPIVPGALALVL
jgi:hypothetical protein